MRIERVYVENVIVGERHRKLDPAKVATLADSMKAIGLQQPIIAFTDPTNTDYIDAVCLVAGAHRLAAAKKLGWDEIDAVMIKGDEIDRELIEIAENLHRADLTALQRDEQTARYVELTEIKQQRDAESNRAQSAQKVGHRPQSGLRKAAREIGVAETTAREARRVASLSPEAKATAREVGLDDNRTALLEAARQPTPEAQVEYLKTRKTNVVSIDDGNHNYRALVAAWAKASADERRRFRDYIDRPEERAAS